MINKIRKIHSKGVNSGSKLPNIEFMPTNAGRKYRHEIKILLSHGEYLSFSARLKTVVSTDKYSMENGDYFIRSLYLDDIYNTAYTTKIAGTDNRKKYRIRCYNGSKDVIKFECKNKYKDRIHKISFPITYEQYIMFMDGKYDFLTDIEHPLANEVYGLIKRSGLSPSVIVDYDREAYVHPLSNTRLTFDKNLRSVINSYDIFNDNICSLPVFDNRSVIFEIKYDEFIPAHIVEMIASLRGTKMSLSKFCMCKDKLLEVKKYDI